MSDPFHIKIKVRASISTGKNTVHLSNVSERIAESPEQCLPSHHPYDFYVGAWMGDTNPHMQFEMLRGQKDGTGVASLSIPVLDGDHDTVKLGVYVKDPVTFRMRHLASGFRDLRELGKAIEGVASFDAAKSSLLMKDNYSRNQVLLHFCNDGTDLPALRSMCERLRPSVLRENDGLNQSVADMTFGVHNLIEKASNVSNTNGGPNFVNSLCFTQCMDCAINYPLLDMTYSSARHHTPLSILSYMTLATLHYTKQTAEEVLRMDDHDFMHKFVAPLCASFTVCPKTSVYSGDKTLDVKGNLDQSTEDFAMVLCKHFFTSVKDAYVNRFKGTLSDMSNTQLGDHIHSLGYDASDNSRGHWWIADDCETLTGGAKSVAGGVHAEASKAGFHHETLGASMWESTRGLGNLSAVPQSDFHDCAKLLCRYGQLHQNCLDGKTPFAQLGLCIVSAKGASFSTTNCDLNGHACAVGQTVDAEGKASYIIVETTTNLRMRNLPPSCPKKVSIVLSEGTKIFDTTTALGIIAENMGDMLSTKGQTRVAQTIPQSFEGKDPYTSCPFYMASFFLGLRMGATIPGVIPLDGMHHSGKATLAGDAGCDHPLFGAPVAALAADCVKALPINLGKAMGEEDAKAFLGKIEARNRECYPPRAEEDTLNKVASRWGDLEALPKKPWDGHWQLSCAEAFDDADMLRAAREYKGRVATHFNALQSKDPMSDGITMSVSMHMMSVVCHFSVPLPSHEKWDLSCARNMRLALKALPFAGAAARAAAQFQVL